MTELSAIGEAIRYYKLNASGGYSEGLGPCSSDYQMHVPAMGFDTVGPEENKKLYLAGWVK